MSDQQPTAETTYPTIEAVRRHLNDRGYTVSKSTIARHKDDGKIRPNADGVYTESVALKYARAFLKLAVSGKRDGEETADQQRRFMAARASKMELESELLRLKTLAEQGKYVPRIQVEQDLAARAMMLKSGFRHLLQSGIGEFVHLVGGDPRKAPDLLQELSMRVERLLSDYASAASVVLSFTGPDEAEMETDEEEAGNPVA